MPCGSGTDDALFCGQELGGRVAPVAARGRDDVTAPGPDVLGAGTGVGQDPDDPLPFEEPGRKRRRLVGGDVECPGHGTHGVPSGERRSEQGDGQCPGTGGAGIHEALFVDLPVVERHAILAGQDPEDLLDLFGSMWRDHFVTEGSVEVVDCCRARAARAVGEFNVGELLGPTVAQHVARDAASRLAFPCGEGGSLGCLRRCCTSGTPSPTRCRHGASRTP